MKYILSIILLLISLSPTAYATEVVLVDKQASRKTVALFRNLKKLQDEGKVLFGHQHATEYGRTWSGDKDRSDVKDMTGSYPAVIGLDFMSLRTREAKGFEKAKESLVTLVVDTYNRGGVSTFAWHAPNPANDGSFYWKDNSVKVVPDIIPGGKLHEKYKLYLEAIADVAKGFKDANGELIPVIFRPFHEYDGDWFWWGKGHCTKSEFITLWRFTVEYLRDNLGMHNFIYAFSPDCKFKNEKQFLEYYPGDEYVDMLGMDNYHDFNPKGGNNPQLAAKKLKIVSDVAARKGKLAALTETGLEGIPQADWFTATLLPVLQSVKVCYVLVWRNATDNPTHYYAPDKGHPAEKDFKKFCEKDNILLENELPDMYK